MKPMNERDPVRVGTITLILLALFGAMFVAFTFMNFGTKPYTAVLEHTGGLRSGEDVQVHGVSKGKVTGIELQDDHVLVSFALDSDIDLGSTTTAKVKVATLLGSHYLEVDPQGPGSLDGDEIALERTQVPFNLQDVLEKGSEAIDTLDPELLAQALTSMASTLGASQEEIGPALQGVARLSEAVAKRSDQVGGLLKSTRKVTDQLSDSSKDIVGLMQQTNLVVTEITSRKDAIHRLLTETTQLSRALTAIVKATDGKLKPALTDLNKVIATLNGQNKQLTHLLDLMGPSVRYIANATGSGPILPLYLKPPAIPGDDSTCKLQGRC